MMIFISRLSLLALTFGLWFTPFYACYSMDTFELKVDGFKDGETSVEIYKSPTKVAYYEMLFKQNFPEIKPLSMKNSLTFKKNAFHTHVELGTLQGSARSIQEIYFSDNLKYSVLVCFTHEKMYLGGMVSLIPGINYYTYAGETGFNPKHVGNHWLAEITTSDSLSFISYKASYPQLDEMLEFIEKNIGKNQFNGLQVSLISNFYSEHLFQVCRYLKNRGVPLTAAHFPKLVLECFPHLNKKFYDPQFFSYRKGKFYHRKSPSSWVTKVALDSYSGKFSNTFDLTLSFPNPEDCEVISIPKGLPSSSWIEEIQAGTRENTTFIYDTQKVQAYKSKVKFLFPKARKISFGKAFPPLNSFDVNKVDTGEILYQTDASSQTIYATEGVWDCVALIMINPKYNLMAICHQPWKDMDPYGKKGESQEKGVKTLPTYPHLNKMIKAFNKELPKDYKKSTKVSLISYYLSKNLINLGAYIKQKGFTVSHISHNDLVITKQNKIYLDPQTVYRTDRRNYDRLTGTHLQPRKVVVNQAGKMSENWSYTIVNPAKETQKEEIRRAD